MLSSQERMSSGSSERESNGNGVRSSPSSWATSTSEEQKPKLVTSSELPADFPRPDLLLQKDQALLVPPAKKGATTRMERLDRLDEGIDRADPSWTISAEEEAKTQHALNDDEYHGTTKPVQVFDKRNGDGKSARSQRDTTRGPMEKAPVVRRKIGNGNGQQRHGMVEFDIVSPELLIMDDYGILKNCCFFPSFIGCSPHSLQNPQQRHRRQAVANVVLYKRRPSLIGRLTEEEALRPAYAFHQRH